MHGPLLKPTRRIVHPRMSVLRWIVSVVSTDMVYVVYAVPVLFQRLSQQAVAGVRAGRVVERTKRLEKGRRDL
jgi:hypothetical protein